jgi:TatD DNase family protein
MTIYDTHAHIYLDQFKEDVDDVIEYAREKEVAKIIMPNIDHTSIEDMLELENRFQNYCYAAMGLHPCSVGREFEKELYTVEKWLNERPFLAIGETGLDLYWDKTYFEQQKEALKIQIAFAKKFEIPIILHTRDSMDETIELIEEQQDGQLTGVFHCFTGNLEQAKRIKELNFFVGLGGVSTFKNGGMDKIIPKMDFDHVVLETDSPYLAPVPYRGKRNQPGFVRVVLEYIALLTSEEVEDIASITSANADRLFNFHEL